MATKKTEPSGKKTEPVGKKTEPAAGASSTPTEQTPDEKLAEAAAVTGAVGAKATAVSKGTIGWVNVVIASVFGLFYAYFVWTAIGNMLELPNFYKSQVKDPATIPWAVLWLGLAVPIVVYAFAFAATLRRSIFVTAIIYLTGLAVTAGLSLSIVALHSLIFQSIPHLTIPGN
jgi:hypothetical protein